MRDDIQVQCARKSCCNAHFSAHYVLKHYTSATAEPGVDGTESRDIQETAALGTFLRVEFSCGDGRNLHTDVPLYDLSCGEKGDTSNDVPCSSVNRFSTVPKGHIAASLSCKQTTVSSAKRKTSFENVVIVQVDNRKLPSHNLKLSDAKVTSWLPEGEHNIRLPYYVMGPALNAWYAKEHGYTYVHYQNKMPKAGPAQTGPMSGVWSCHHPQAGAVYICWCKVLAMRQAMHEYPDADMFVFMDTDTYFSNHTETMSQFMHRVQDIDPRTHTASLIVGADQWGNCHLNVHRRPEECRANSGILFVRNSEAGKLMLKEWWDSAAHSTKCSRNEFLRHSWPFEQGVLNRCACARVAILI